MRFKHLAFPIILAFGLSGCSTIETAFAATTGTIASLDPAAMQAAEKGLTAAHLTHQAAADGLIVAVQAGLHGSAASTAQNWLDQSEVILKAADASVVLGDAPGIEAKISAANVLLAKVQSAISGSK